jgi:hypothetical protein
MIILTILLLASVLMLFMNAGAEIAFFSLGYKDLGRENCAAIERTSIIAFFIVGWEYRF